MSYILKKDFKDFKNDDEGLIQTKRRYEKAVISKMFNDMFDKIYEDDRNITQEYANEFKLYVEYIAHRLSR